MEKKIITTLLLLSFYQGYSQRVNESNLIKHIAVLAHDSLEGRGTGSKGEEKAANYIVSQLKQLKIVPYENNNYLLDFEFKNNLNPHGEENQNDDSPKRSGKNIAGFINNNANKTIVIGAHYDHLGLGHDKNSLDANPADKIHNGADDNASGVSGVLELGRMLKEKNNQSFNYLFLFFSAEELGLIGSKKFVEQKIKEYDKIHAMINMDMIGRLNDSTKKLMVYGVGTALEFNSILDKKNNYFTLVKDSSGVGPSDHTSFYLKNIPVLHFFSGQHADYHKPSDDAEKVNYAGEEKILNYIFEVINELANYPQLTFNKTRDSKNDDTPKLKVTLGIMPDYSYEGKGLRIDGVTKNKPADNAGLIQGDIIIEMNNSPVNNIQDYMKQLSKLKKGDQTILKILRDNSSRSVNINL